MRFADVLLSYEKVSCALVESMEWPIVEEGGLGFNSLMEVRKS